MELSYPVLPRIGRGGQQVLLGAAAMFGDDAGPSDQGKIKQSRCTCQIGGIDFSCSAMTLPEVICL